MRTTPSGSLTILLFDGKCRSGVRTRFGRAHPRRCFLAKEISSSTSPTSVSYASKAGLPRSVSRARRISPSHRRTPCRKFSSCSSRNFRCPAFSRRQKTPAASLSFLSYSLSHLAVFFPLYILSSRVISSPPSAFAPILFYFFISIFFILSQNSVFPSIHGIFGGMRNVKFIIFASYFLKFKKNIKIFEKVLQILIQYAMIFSTREGRKCCQLNAFRKFR